MPSIKVPKIKPFMALATIQVMFACVILANELLAIYNRRPGGNYPIEIKYSWTRVLLFCGGAIISFVIAWVFNSKKQLIILLPSFKSVLLLALLPTLSSVLSNYMAFMGWCCEQPFGYFFGFPFSFVHGIVGFDSSVLQYANYGLFEILTTSEFTVNWKFFPYQFFLNFLFWSNIVFVLLNLVILFRQKNNLLTLTQENVQVENN